MTDKAFDTLLSSFKNVQQHQVIGRSRPPVLLPPSKPHKLHIPSPKAPAYDHKPPPNIPCLHHNIFQRYQYNAPTKHYDVQHLAAT